MKGRVTKTGYKKNSPDVKNDYNIIPSGRITMQDVEFPVYGVDNLGYAQMMYPGGEYDFPGEYVMELPMYGSGGLTQWFAEEWKDIKTGKPCGRQEGENRSYPACRPSRRVNETTPKTSSEMSAAEKEKFRKAKTSKKRIDYNHKREFGGALPQYQTKGEVGKKVAAVANQMALNGEDGTRPPLNLIDKMVALFDKDGVCRDNTCVNVVKDIYNRSGYNVIPESVYNNRAFRDNYDSYGLQLVAPQNKGRYILDDLQPGDIIQYRHDGNSGGILGKEGYPFHLGVYTENGQYVSDGSKDDPIKKQSVFYYDDGTSKPPFDVFRLRQLGGSLPKAQDGSQLAKYQTKGEVSSYTVASGDTFYGIANRQGVDKQALLDANPGLDIENLKVGQSINLPNVITPNYVARGNKVVSVPNDIYAQTSPIFKSEAAINAQAKEKQLQGLLDLNNTLNYLVSSRGNTPEFWTNTADTIAHHESWHTMDPKTVQADNGPAKGMFQFEGPAFETFKRRYQNVANSLGLDTDPNILKANSADQLTAEQQYTAFLVNLIESDAVLKDYADGKMSIEDLWLTGHKNVEAKGDRASFQESLNKARKEGIKGGYKDFKSTGGQSTPSYDKYDTLERAWFAARKDLGKGKVFMYGGEKHTTLTPKGL